MEKKVWGNSIWYLFHTVAEKIKEDKYLEQKDNLFKLLEIVLKNLPCPDCAEHATNAFKKVNKQNINNKETFKMLMLEFHNRVNKRLNKPVFTLEELNNKYKNANLNAILYNFRIVYNISIYNEKLIANAFHKNLQNKDLNNVLNQILQNCN